MKDFHGWLAELLGKSEIEVQNLFKDATAQQFLIAWSLFESKCFYGFLREKQIKDYSEKIANDQTFDVTQLTPSAKHFHDRYQNSKHFSNLIHSHYSQETNDILVKNLDLLDAKEIVFLVTFVTYRFRNNIFHGTKGVDSWLRYKPQIVYCIEVMQYLISHSESKSPTMNMNI
ncbi:MAG: hypothetical protein SVM79_03600 [Chloroflexota bacterium]|nr:hypothetical protein [Chloroflexota bacterium]